MKGTPHISDCRTILAVRVWLELSFGSERQTEATAVNTKSQPSAKRKITFVQSKARTLAYNPSVIDRLAFYARLFTAWETCMHVSF